MGLLFELVGVVVINVLLPDVNDVVEPGEEVILIC